MCVPSVPLVVADNKILGDILSCFLLCRITGDIICFVEASKKDLNGYWLGACHYLMLNVNVPSDGHVFYGGDLLLFEPRPLPQLLSGPVHMHIHQLNLQYL
jgi:hypothetical protein